MPRQVAIRFVQQSGRRLGDIALGFPCRGARDQNHPRALRWRQDQRAARRGRPIDRRSVSGDIDGDRGRVVIVPLPKPLHQHDPALILDEGRGRDVVSGSDFRMAQHRDRHRQPLWSLAPIVHLHDEHVRVGGYEAAYLQALGLNLALGVLERQPLPKRILSGANGRPPTCTTTPAIPPQ
jgi:hypothetical protein